ncbi:hypothetical protein J6W78_07575 [bacterium]|nr:hypothetical protein [bacterium]
MKKSLFKTIGRIKNLLKRLKRFVWLNQTELLYIHSGKIVCCGSAAAVIKIEKVTLENVDDAKSFQSENYIRFFRNFLKKGAVGYYAYKDGVCVHRSWVFEQKMQIHSLVAEPLLENQVYIAWCETAAFARGLGIYPQVLSRIVQDYSAKQIFIAVNKNNTASIRGIEKAGFELCRTYRIKRVLGKTDIVVE